MFGLTHWRNDSPWVVGNINFGQTFDDFNKIFDNYFTNSRCSDGVITECKTNYKIEVVAPGIDKSKLKLKLKDRLLTLSYKSEEKTKSKFSKQSFIRKVSLPENANLNEIKAEYIDGIVTIKVTKTEAGQTTDQEIKIKSN